MARLTSEEKAAVVARVARLRHEGATWDEVAADPEVPVSAGSALRWFKEAGEPGPDTAEVVDEPPADPEFERDGFTPLDPTRVWHPERGWGVVLGKGPASYSEPHTVVRFEADGETARVPDDELEGLDEHA